MEVYVARPKLLTLSLELLAAAGGGHVDSTDPATVSNLPVEASFTNRRSGQGPQRDDGVRQQCARRYPPTIGRSQTQGHRTYVWKLDAVPDAIGLTDASSRARPEESHPR
jgi:hypothetical protein